MSGKSFRARLFVVGGFIFCATLIFSLAVSAQRSTATPSFILKNGKILTVDGNFSVAQAVAITDNQIAAVGTDDDISKLAGPATQVIDLKGRTVIPGLIDTHRHIYERENYDGKLTPEQMRNYPVDWRGVTTVQDVLNQIKGIMDKYHFKPGEWIYFTNQLSFMGAAGGRATQSKILFNDLNRWELDKVTPNNPIAMSEGIPDQNGLLVNGKAMDILMASHADFLKKFGKLWVDAGGRPDGHMEPPATRLVLDVVPQPDPSVVGPEYKKMLDELGAMGITTVSTQLTEDRIKAYQWLESQGEMTIRMAYGKATDFGTFADVKSRTKQLAKLVGTGDDKIWVNSVAPSNVDGSGSRACMSKKRETTYGAVDDFWPMGQCHMDVEYNGAAGKAQRISENYYREWVLQGGVNGLRFANTHVAGERTVSILLGLADQVQKQAGMNAIRGFSMDHCTFINPRDFKEAARLGVTFSCAPKYIMDNAPQASKAYGEDVANTWVVPVKGLLDAGVKVVFEADDDKYVWDELELLQTRKDKNGKVWGPQERIDRTTVLKMATRWAADYVLKGDKLGSIEPGKLADMVVIDQDYMQIPVEQFHTVQPQLTIFNGKIVFAHPQFAQENNLKPKGAVVATYSDLVARRARTGGAVD